MGISIPIIVIPYFINSFVVRFELIELTAKAFFLETMILESFIMIGLVPVNTHYQMVFERSTVGMRIVDSSGATKINDLVLVTRIVLGDEVSVPKTRPQRVK